MDNKSLLDEFFDFEIKNKLFDIKDRHGIHIWDIVRYHVYAKLQNNDVSVNSSKRLNLFFYLFNLKRIKRIVKHIINDLSLIFSSKQYDTLFYLVSRAELNGNRFDQYSYDVLQIFGQTNSLLLESFFTIESVKDNPIYKRNYYFSFYIAFYVKIRSFFSSIKSHDEIDIICSKITKGFPNTNCKRMIRYELNYFYMEKFLFSYLIKRYKIKRFFLVQNGIKKSLFLAAQECEIPIFEFQHCPLYGNVAYSYHDDPSIERKIYLPTYLLLFSNYWIRGVNYPGMQKIIGNNYIAKNVIKKHDNNFLLIISIGNPWGNLLLDLTMNIADKLDKKIILKLHPNQYCEYNFYREYFKNKKMVQVIASGLSINSLLFHSYLVVAINSTGVYEALQGSVPVCIYEIGPYEGMEPLRGLEGVSFFHTIDEFLDIEKHILPIKHPPRFFEPFHPEVAETLVYT
jgi:hypothetical protein